MSSERGCVGSNENWFSFLKGLLIHSSVSMVGVCSLGGIWERPLKGPFHFCKSPTPPRILHRSSLTIHITSSLSLWQCHLLGHHSPCLPLDLYYIHRCSSTTGLLCPLLIYSLPLPLELSRNSRRCSITGFFCLQILHLIYYLSFFWYSNPSNMWWRLCSFYIYNSHADSVLSMILDPDSCVGGTTSHVKFFPSSTLT